MDYRPEPALPFARRAGALALDPAFDPVAAPAVPIRFAPPLGEGRRLPAARFENREPRRTSARRRRSIAEVNAAIAVRSPAADTAPVAAPEPSSEATRKLAGVPAPDRVPTRWARFEELVLGAGVSRERLFDAFPDVEDIEDIIRTPDEDLAACAATLAEALRGAVPARAAPVAEASSPSTAVRCADCRHFARSPAHPRLGRCAAGEAATAAGGWWDTQRRDCASFDGGR